MRQKLKTIADIRTGYQFRGKVREDPKGSHWVVQIRDFNDHRKLDVSNMARVDPDRDPTPYLAMPGDVLFLSRGHKLWAAHLAQPPKNAIVTGYFFTLRLKNPAVSPAYLAWYLNQAPFQSALRPFVRGSQMPLISLGDFEQLKIDFPPMRVQEILVSLEDLVICERELRSTIQRMHQRLINAICLRAVQTQEEGD